MFRIFVFAVLGLGCLTWISVANASELLKVTDSGRFEFPTISFWKNKEVTGTGELNLPPDVSGKVPLVVLVHGTRGVGYREESWSDFLLNRSYATFILDYFSPRGVDGRGRKVPRPGEDVWGAIGFLSSHPGLDMKRVAVMGFSNGGSVTQRSAAFDPEFDMIGVFPKAFIMVYGGCHSEIAFNARDYNPALLYIAGSEDNLVKAETCLDRKNDTVSSDIDVMVIEGAYHMFDGDTSKTINHPKWGEIELRADSDATEMARKRVIQLLERVF